MNLAEKIGVKVYANQDSFVSNITTLFTDMISIVLSSLIIYDFYKGLHSAVQMIVIVVCQQLLNKNDEKML